MIRTNLTHVAPVFKVGDIVAFNPERNNSVNGTYSVKITEINTNPNPYHRHVFYPKLKGVVVSSDNQHFSVGEIAGFYEMRWFDLVPFVVEKARKPQLSKAMRDKWELVGFGQVKAGDSYLMFLKENELHLASKAEIGLEKEGCPDRKDYYRWIVKPKMSNKMELKKFTVFSYDGVHRVMAKDAVNAALNIAKKTGYDACSMKVYRGHIVQLI